MSLHPTTYALIDLDALVANYRIIAAESKAEVLCVVKADSYGHGAIPCARALYRAGGRFFGVANAAEALELRRALPSRDARILILGYTHPDDVPLLIESDLIQTVYSAEQAASLLARVPKGSALTVHFKLDSGMNRLGFPADEASRGETVKQILSLTADARLICDGIFTHFACADEPESGMTDRQWQDFSFTLAALEKEGFNPPHVHTCNSAGICRFGGDRGNLVRAGIILYGIPPSDSVTLPDLTPVMSLHTHVTHLHTVRAGQTIGYGATFTADRDLRVATLAIGYADGLVRAYAKGGVRIGGRLCPILGRICMDQCMVDVTGVDVKVGDEAVFFDQALPVTHLSRCADIIPYETVCLIGKRVVRIYRGEQTE